MRSRTKRLWQEKIDKLSQWALSLRVPAVCLALVAITFVVFGQTLHHDFINFDDKEYVYNNPMVAKGLTLKGTLWAFTGFHASNWHPLTWLSHMLDCQLYGLNPGRHHLTNVLLHTATVIALFLVLRQMTGAIWRSALVAAIFAIHPLRVESVAWVAERKDVLSGLFFVLTIGAYVRYARLPWSGRRYGLVVLLFAMGLMCKPMLVTLPLVLLLLDDWPLQRAESTKKLIMEKLPLLALSAVSCVVTLLAQRHVIQSTESISLLFRFCNALVSPMIYLGQMVCPAGLAVLYPYLQSGLPVSEVVLAGTLLAGLSALAVWQWRKQPWLLIGWLWYLVMLLPVIGIVQVSVQAHADRYTYLPQIGIYVALAWMVAQWRMNRLVIGGLMTGVLAVLMVCAWKQTAYWQDSETLWNHTLDCTTGNFIAHNDLGDVLLQADRWDEAVTQFQKALQINPAYAEANNNIGFALVKMGKADEAIPYFQKALQISPSFVLAHNNLGIALLRNGSVDEAIAQYREALKINPDYEASHYNLALALLQKSNVDEAITQFQNALQINPGNADIHYRLASALRQTGRVDEAKVHYQKTLQLKPDFAESFYNLGNDLHQQGNEDEAIAQYQESLQINPDYAAAHINLGSVLQENGRLDEAIAQFQQALRINSGSVQAQNNLGNAFLQKGNVAEAIAHFQQAIQIKPTDPWSKNNLAWILATCAEASMRDGKKAVELATQADDLVGGEKPVILGTLAAAYAEAGRFSEAVETAQRALNLAEAQSKITLAGQLQAQLKLYQAGQPFHSPAPTH